MSQPVDKYLMNNMIEDEDHEIIADVIDGTDDAIDSMMEEKSRIEVADSIFPVLEKYKDVDDDPFITAIGESMGLIECKCGNFLQEGERCNTCRKKNKRGKLV